MSVVYMQQGHACRYVDLATSFAAGQVVLFSFLSYVGCPGADHDIVSSFVAPPDAVVSADRAEECWVDAVFGGEAEAVEEYVALVHVDVI